MTGSGSQEVVGSLDHLDVHGKRIDIASPAAVTGAVPPMGWPLRRIRHRWWFLLVWVLAMVIFLNSDPGRITFDTKLGVDIDAAGFYARLWSLWNPLEWFGTLQNQYIGYSIPMGPFFLAGQTAHLPVWVIERLWLSVLVTAAFAGMVELATAVRAGTAGSRLIAGAIFALWPSFTIMLGSTSAGALPGMLLPWAVLPLVRVAQGKTGITRGAARSGAAIALMGGVNAASTMAVLILPALYILTRPGLRVRLGAAWAAAVAAAISWWAIPLLLQGRYSFNFLPYIEQTVTTARTMSAAAVLRGSGNWTAYFDLGGVPWLSAGWVMVTSPAAIGASTLVASLGLYGLARRDMPERRWLVCAAGATAAIALADYFGPLSGPFHTYVDALLDTTLAPLRSTYKLEPVIAVALALGCAHALARLRGLVRLAGTAYLAVAVSLIVVVLAGLALPQLTGRELQGSFTSIPRYWYQAASFLAAHSARETSLVVPADPHGQFLWGDTTDNPLEPLASSPWVERGIVPYGGAGSQQLLDTIESAFESGQQVPGLAAYLDRTGIRYVVVRNDLSLTMTGYTAPQTVNETLALSGFQRVASFGPPVASAPAYPAGLTPGYAPSYPAVEIFEAIDPGLRAVSPVSVMPVSGTTLVNGGADSLLQLGGQGILSPGTPAVIAGDTLPTSPALWAVTDGQRRSDNTFSNTQDYASFTYTATQTNPPDDPRGGAGAAPRQILPVPAHGHQTVAVLSGAASVTASSYGSWLTESPQYDPVNAFDGNPGTAWTEGDPATPTGQWIQIDFSRAVTIPASIGIRLLDDTPYRSMASGLEVTTSNGSATTSVGETGSRQQIAAPPGPTRWLRITITNAVNVFPGALGAGISDVLIPGVSVTKYLQPAQSRAGTSAPSVAYSFQRQDSDTALARTFSTSGPARLRLAMTAVPVAGAAMNTLLDRLTPFPHGTALVTTSSTWEWNPLLGGDNLFTANSTLPWLAAAGDPDPTVTVRWYGERTISRLTVIADYGQASAPSSVVVRGQGRSELALMGHGGAVTLERPIRTNWLSLSFPSFTYTSATGSADQPSVLPLGLSKVIIPALRGLRLTAPSPSTPFRLACGYGPAMTIDGRVYQTSVTGTIGDLERLSQVTVRPCTPGATVTLPAGRHWLIAGQSALFTTTGVRLTGGTTMPATASRSVQVLRWGADSRTLRVGPGSSSYVEIHENYNTGWVATLDGQRLRPVVLDGWQQAFVVPAGKGGVIALSYAPQTGYHIGIVVSVVALAALLAVAIGVRRRRGDYGQQTAPDARQGLPQGVPLAALVTVVFVAGGPAAIAVPVLAYIRRLRPRWLPGIAAASMVTAGVIAAAWPSVSLGSGTFSGPAQALALIALAAALMPRARRVTVAEPFSPVDELSCYYDAPGEPNNVHLEAVVDGTLDESAFRAAVASAVTYIPRARMRRARSGPLTRRFRWEPSPGPDADPVTCQAWSSHRELDQLRSDFLATSPPLRTAPPFRVLLALGPGRTIVVINAHHAAFDGLSCLEILRAIGRAYSAEPAPADVDTPRQRPATAAGAPPAQARALRPVTRIAPRPARDNTGYGFCLLDPIAVPKPGTPVTVNDVLVAALILTVGRWNAGYGEPADNIKITVPLNDRPPGTEQVTGNHSRLATVSAPSDAADLLERVADQTRWAKLNRGPQVDPFCRALAAVPLPVMTKRGVLRLSLRWLGRWACDTTLLSNLGNIPTPLEFGAAPVSGLAFSTSAHMPRGLSVGAVGLNGTLHLCVRYRRALLDDDAAREFSRMLSGAVAELSAMEE